MSITIRVITLGDLDALNALMVEIHELHVEGEPRVFRGPLAPVYSREHIEQALAKPDDRLFGAFEDESLIGFLWAQFRVRAASHTHHRRRLVFVDTLVVARSHQGRGVGRMLIDTAEQWGKDRGATEAVLTVWQFNEAAIAFYERLGYESEQIRMFKPLADGR